MSCEILDFTFASKNLRISFVFIVAKSRAAVATEINVDIAFPSHGYLDLVTSTFASNDTPADYRSVDRCYLESRYYP